jgi:hypothetical protein
MEKDLRCCGNCYHLDNKYFPSLEQRHIFKEDFDKCYPGEDFYMACNTVMCKKGHYPKHVDNVCDDWQYDEQKYFERNID